VTAPRAAAYAPEAIANHPMMRPERAAWLCSLLAERIREFDVPPLLYHHDPVEPVDLRPSCRFTHGHPVEPR